MFVRLSKYQKLQKEAMVVHFELNTVRDRLNNLLTKYNKLVIRINELGGEAFLQGKEARQQKQVEVRGFTEAELKSLLQLVHPDKHNGKESAVRMTQLINKLRG